MNKTAIVLGEKLSESPDFTSYTAKFEIVDDDAPVNTPAKLCKDCRFFKLETPQCNAPGNTKPDYVNGGVIYEWNMAQPVRVIERYCGPTAAWFEPKDTPA